MFEALIDHFHVARQITNRESSPKPVNVYKVNEIAYRLVSYPFSPIFKGIQLPI